jgi:hypothetical protein
LILHLCESVGLLRIVGEFPDCLGSTDRVCLTEQVVDHDGLEGPSAFSELADRSLSAGSHLFRLDPQEGRDLSVVLAPRQQELE